MLGVVVGEFCEGEQTDIQGNGIPRLNGNWEAWWRANRFVMNWLALAASRAGPHIVGGNSDKSGPVEVASDVSKCSASAGLPCEAMIVTGARDIQMDSHMVGDIEGFFRYEELSNIG